MLKVTRAGTTEGALGSTIDVADGELDGRVDRADLGVERACHARERGERIAPLILRKRAGVPLGTLDDHLERLLALDAGDDTDHVPCGFEHRSLLDMQFEIARPRESRAACAGARERPRASRSSASPTLMPSASRAAPIASRLRSPAKASDPIMPGAKRLPSSFIQATTIEVARRHLAPLRQRLHRFECRQHAGGAVELAARGLAVEMAAEKNGRRCAVAAG